MSDVTWSSVILLAANKLTITYIRLAASASCFPASLTKIIVSAGEVYNTSVICYAPESTSVSFWRNATLLNTLTMQLQAFTASAMSSEMLFKASVE
jgi:hypothetical protein